MSILPILTSHSVPASSPKFLQKSLNLRPDTISYDLEDSVTESQKPTARSSLVSFLSDTSSLQPLTASKTEISVRINAVETPHALQDLQAFLPLPSVQALVVPKVQSASDLHFINDVIRHVRPTSHPPVKIIALIESARAITDLKSICEASPYLDGLIFAAEDFAHDLSITRTPNLTEFLWARGTIVAHARAASLTSTIDLVCTSFRGSEGMEALAKEAEGGMRMGFNGKQCIHPSQVEVVQKAFAPGDKEVEWAVRVCVADAKADVGGRGAWTLDGKMIDVPVVRKAREVIKRAERCGIDVKAVEEKWKDQEPE